jgi:hypothetical protein
MTIHFVQFQSRDQWTMLLILWMQGRWTKGCLTLELPHPA